MNICVIKGYKLDNQTSMDLYSVNLSAHLRKIPSVTANEISPITSLERITSGPVRKFTNLFDRLVRYPFDLRRRISKMHTDVFHITDHVNSYLISSLPKDRTVITCHDLIPLLAANGDLENIEISKKSLLHFKYRISGLIEAAHIVAVSENTKMDLVRFNLCKSENVSVVHLGMNHDYKPYSSEQRRKLRSAYNFDDKFVLLHVGSSLFYKNIEGIIEALSILSKYDVNGKFVFMKAGQPFTAQQNELIDRYKLSSRVIHVGAPKNTEEMQNTYNMANVLVFPSLYEGFGWPPLEAMACGIPVITSNCGSLPEVVADAALFCDPASPDSIVSQLMALCNDDELCEKIIRRGMARAEQFTWGKTAEKMLDVYRKLLSGIST